MAVETALSNKVNGIPLLATGAEQQTWIERSDQTYDYITSLNAWAGDVDSTKTPFGANRWYTVLYHYVNSGARHQIWTDSVTGISVARWCEGGTWSGFVGATTPPQEYDLPLAAGYVKLAGWKCCYSKAQDGTVLVHVATRHTSGMLPVGNCLCATLPAGFRPAEIVGDDKGFGRVAVGTLGDVTYEITSAISTMAFTLEFRTT